MDPLTLKSFEKINYTIRPSKQVERKLFIETFHRLRKIGYDISEYTYVGFGSIYYVDFILFHKYLYIDDMICLEKEEIERRMKFNRPYDFITLIMKPFSEVIPSLDRDKKYIVWLDYDYGLNKDVMEDIGNLIGILKPGCILIVTVDAEPKIHENPIMNESLTRDQREEFLVSYYNEAFQNHVREIRKSDITENELPRLFAKIINSKIQSSLVSRVDDKYYQLFNFVYADGAQMLTIGGIIDLKAKENPLKDCGLFNQEYIQPGLEPIRISVPALTIREKHWLDSQDHSKLKKGELELSFELEDELLTNYLKYYRHYPTFHEVFI